MAVVGWEEVKEVLLDISLRLYTVCGVVFINISVLERLFFYNSKRVVNSTTRNFFAC